MPSTSAPTPEPASALPLALARRAPKRRLTEAHATPRRRLRAPLLRNSLLALAAAALLGLALPSRAEDIGEVSTAFKLVGPNHKVVVEAYDDPAVQGVTCYVSRARTGGVKGALGLAEDKSEASIACRQVGPIGFARGPLPRQDEVFNERQSILFKRLRVVRMVDSARNTLVYLSYSDKLIDGSPANSVTAVPVEASHRIPLR